MQDRIRFEMSSFATELASPLTLTSRTFVVSCSRRASAFSKPCRLRRHDELSLDPNRLQHGVKFHHGGRRRACDVACALEFPQPPLVEVQDECTCAHGDGRGWLRRRTTGVQLPAGEEEMVCGVEQWA